MIQPERNHGAPGGRWALCEESRIARRGHLPASLRHGHILAHLRAAGLGAPAHLGFRGLDDDLHGPVIVTGFHTGRTRMLTLARRKRTASFLPSRPSGSEMPGKASGRSKVPGRPRG
ncbi:hypothetical protein ACFWAZ_27695 [Streptomyces collinus]|uniref:hypothetical protein n=1 Tax=Streptomyces collinus TaxID=42684 RepID=UPI00365C30DA